MSSLILFSLFNNHQWNWGNASSHDVRQYLIRLWTVTIWLSWPAEKATHLRKDYKRSRGTWKYRRLWRRPILRTRRNMEIPLSQLRLLPRPNQKLERGLNSTIGVAETLGVIFFAAPYIILFSWLFTVYSCRRIVFFLAIGVIYFILHTHPVF